MGSVTDGFVVEGFQQLLSDELTLADGSRRSLVAQALEMARDRRLGLPAR